MKRAPLMTAEDVAEEVVHNDVVWVCPCGRVMCSHYEGADDGAFEYCDDCYAASARRNGNVPALCSTPKVLTRCEEADRARANSNGRAL